MQQNRWTNIAKDSLLSGNAGIKGHMDKAPEPFFSLDLARKYVYFTLAAGHGNCSLDLEAMGELNTRTELGLYKNWQASYPEFHQPGEKPLFMEYDQIPYYYYGKVGYFIPGMNQLQWIQCDTCFDSPQASRTRAAQNKDEELYVRLRVLRDGQWQNLWETENIDYLACGQPAIGDFDGDGELELVITPWYNCIYFDLRTGRQKYMCRAIPEGTESGRVYGLTMAVDVDGDGIDEVVTICGMENHAGLQKFVDGQMRQIWSNLYEKGSMRKKSVLHLIQEPVADVDGDGVKEVCLPIFNLADDQKWHLLVIDGMTGQIRSDIAGFYLKQIKSAGNAVYLFGYDTEHVEEGGEMRVKQFQDGRLVTVFSRTGHFLETPICQPKANLGHFPLRPLFKLADLEDNQGLLFFTQEEGKYQSYRTTAAGIDREGSFECDIEIECVNVVSHQGTALLRVKLPVGGKTMVHGQGVAMSFIGRTVGDFHNAQPLIADYDDGLTRVVVESDDNNIDAFVVQGDALVRAFSVQGRGSNYFVPWNRDPVLFDLDGRRNFALACFTAEEGGLGALTAFDRSGRIIWKHLMDGAPFATLGALCKDHLQDGPGEDILAFALKNHGVSWGYAIDGKTGDLLWQRDQGVPMSKKQDTALPFGGQVAPIADLDGDGESEIVIAYPYHLSLYKGKTGELLRFAYTMGWTDDELFPDLPHSSGGWAIPAVVDVLGDGRRQILFAGTTYLISLIDPAGEKMKSLWQDVHPLWAPEVLPGIGDIDGDGQVEVFSPGWRVNMHGHENGFRCFDIRSGAEKWRFAMEGACFGHCKAVYWNSPTMTVTSDLNGDGRDEAYFGIDNKLFCVGVPAGETTGRILWTKEFPAKISHPTPAIINGQAVMIVTCADGRLYMVR